MLTTSIALAASVVNADVTLTFGTYTADKPSTTVKKFRPFLDYLAREMSAELSEPVTIRMRVARDYESGIDDLADGTVDFARFGPASYITAHQRNPAIRIVAIESKKGGKRFNGVIAVHRDSDFGGLADLAGHSFAFGDQLSTIGRYLSQAHLLQAGISGAQLERYEYLGRHDLVGSAVGLKRFSAGALKESTYESLVESGVPLRPLFTFPNVTKPWLAAAEVEPRVFQAMQRVMLTVDDPKVTASINKDGFLAGGDADYDFVRAAMAASGRF